MKPAGSLLPEHEGLRPAVQWLAAQASWDAKTIEEASLRFDLSPIDEEFLLRHFHDAGRGNENTGTLLSVRQRGISSRIGKHAELRARGALETRRR